MKLTAELIRKEYTDLPTSARAVIKSVGVAAVVVKLYSYADLVRRDSQDIRGPKWAWAVTLLFSGVGPAAYWTLARRLSRS